MIAGTERDRECRSSTESGTRGLDLAVLQPDELANDGEAKAEAAVAACSRAVRLPEPIEHMRKKAGVYPDSGSAISILMRPSSFLALTEMQPSRRVNLTA